jgi:hypothetical protein
MLNSPKPTITKARGRVWRGGGGGVVHANPRTRCGRLAIGRRLLPALLRRRNVDPLHVREPLLRTSHWQKHSNYK